MMIQQGTSEAISQGGGSYTLGFHILPALTHLGYLAFANPYLINFFPRLVEIVRNSSGLGLILTLFQVFSRTGGVIAIITIWIKGNWVIRYLLVFMVATFLPYTPWSIPSLWDASRYLYLPSIAFSILLAYGIIRLAEIIASHVHRPVWLLASALILIFMVVNVVPLQALLAQLHRSGEIRQDVIQQMLELQPAFPGDARVFLELPHGIYSDLQYGLPEFYSTPITVVPIPPKQLPSHFSPGDYYFIYKDGRLEQIKL